MMRYFIITIFAFLMIPTFSQRVDSVKAQVDTTYQIDEFVVTATRTMRGVNDVPVQVDVINAQQLQDFSLNNIDDILRTSANVYVNRSWGIFSKNSSVTMRGLESSDRTLVLIDGVPKNKLSGGPINWHNINPESIERIEVIKGPASALYGNNAMGGVINIITKKPVKPAEGTAKLFAGSYNTYGGLLNAGGSLIKNNRGVYWNVNSFYRQGDGYIFEPAEALDSTDYGTFLKEYGGGTKIGYQFNRKHSLELVYDYYNEQRGAGRKIFEQDGSYDSFVTNQMRANYKGALGSARVQFLAFYLKEDYYGQKESLNDFLEYRLNDVNTLKHDVGFWTTWSKQMLPKHDITVGAEARRGDVIGDEIYRTSTDLINYKGNLDVYALFVQDEISILKEKLKVIAGIRGDYIGFYNSWQQIKEPTKVTGFKEGFYEDFANHSWNAISPKLAIQYGFNPKTNVYLSVASGYKPPKIDDLAKSGKIRKGFRLANPLLKPETLYNYEIGVHKKIADKLQLNGAIYYSDGRDFQYLVANGDSVDTGGQSLKPVYVRKNVARVEIMGGEFSVLYNLSGNISVDANYSYNHSVIRDYNIEKDNPSKDLSGYYIVEVSPNLFYAGATWRNRLFALGVNCSYTDKQYVDDENLQLLDDFFVVNAKISKSLFKQYKVWLDVQNILDTEFIDRKNQLSPGRFIGGGVLYKF